MVSDSSTASPPGWADRAAFRGLVLLLVALSFCGCDRAEGEGRTGSDADASSDAGADEAIPVHAVRVTRQDVSRVITATTTLSPETSVSLLAEVGGTVRDWSVDVGAEVNRGDIVAVIDVPELDVQLREAQLNLSRIEREVRAVEPLHADGYLSDQAWEDARRQQDAARAALDRLREQARRQRVATPLEGTVLERGVERGEVVSPGALLFRIADLTRLVADISIPERELSRIDVGMDARLKIPAAGDSAVHGTVERIAPTVDRSTGTALVRIAVDAGAVDRLRPGMFTTVEIAAETRQDVLTVPARAIIEEGQRRSVFVVVSASGGAHAPDGTMPEDDESEEDLVVKRVDVTLGLRQGDRQEITAGLEPDDRVVTVGQSRLRDGTRVRLTGDGGA